MFKKLFFFKNISLSKRLTYDWNRSRWYVKQSPNWIYVITKIFERKETILCIHIQTRNERLIYSFKISIPSRNLTKKKHFPLPKYGHFDLKYYLHWTRKKGDRAKSIITAQFLCYNTVLGIYIICTPVNSLYSLPMSGAIKCGRRWYWFGLNIPEQKAFE